MAFLIWNIRGFNSFESHNEIKELVRSKAIDIFSILETKIKPHKAQLIRDTFGPEWESHNNADSASPASPDSIWLFWRKKIWSVDILVSHPQLIHAKLRNSGGLVLFHTPVYGKATSRDDRRQLWNLLQQIGPISASPWLVGGILMK